VTEQQKKIDTLNQQIEQMRAQQAALVAKLKETEAKVPGPAPTPAPPLSSPSVTGPLSMASYLYRFGEFGHTRAFGLAACDREPLKFDLDGVVSGIGIVQNHAVSGDRSGARGRQ